ncbi:2,4-dienoyl-CoA reductase-like NADH-dependent reductase (Old Yellow Enzyme family) [Kushneria sinocarnis]|uniref:2,4-dienoyl-CoA reductase-like NADH-dependent reductase (Old Yellow Enzyme family) n=1 Tax=Kushneria sinocarnis TaxID=595502 RepID=A0A420X014_9GAMM|nr:NADH:flavin oxidoreductase [Kushneria sinocarnis]RKR07198.1 2,4-dienoyl-CoA reductase-like NADH-dependent reductase (Old Yellow Enzyme family) [Kushneria sinocarnis]
MSELNREIAAPLFEGFRLGRLALANRIVMAPMTRNRSPGGVPDEAVADYYASRARGGVGLIITEGTHIDHPGANGYPDVPAFHGEGLAGWRQVVERVHAAGGRIAPQLWHVGRERRPGTEPDAGVPGFGPMAIEEDGVEVVRAMSEWDIQEVVASFARAAADARAVGFDALELHGAHGYLIDQFLWPESNQRTDAYGGSLENRLRFPLMIVRAVREAVGPDFPVIFRFSQWKLSDYDATLADTPEALGALLKPLAEAGVDIFHASTRRMWEPGFAGSDRTLAAWTRELTGCPVIAVGSIGLDRTFRTGHFTRTEDPTSKSRVDIRQLAEQRRRGDFDLIAVGRALLSDPEWAGKVRDGALTSLADFDRNALDSLVR